MRFDPQKWSLDALAAVKRRLLAEAEVYTASGHNTLAAWFRLEAWACSDLADRIRRRLQS